LVLRDNPENPKNSACRAAVKIGGTQALYDWNGINQANAAGKSRTLIPDGQLCSGGKPGFRGLDLVHTGWRATPMQSGPFEFVYYATAPHATKNTIFYITAWMESQNTTALG
jgi:chitin-binding protein